MARFDGGVDRSLLGRVLQNTALKVQRRAHWRPRKWRSGSTTPSGELSLERSEGLTNEELLSILVEGVLRSDPANVPAGRIPIKGSLFRAVISECPTCATTRWATADGPVRLDEETAKALRRDADAEWTPGREGRCAVAQPRSDRSETGDTSTTSALDPGLRPTADSSPAPIPGEPTPPALREFVFSRDGRRCVSCGATGPLHAHHIWFCSQFGPTVPWNLTTLCLRCHGRVHEGLLRIEGIAPHEWTFRTRDGIPRGRHVDQGTPVIRERTAAADAPLDAESAARCN